MKIFIIGAAILLSGCGLVSHKPKYERNDHVGVAHRVMDRAIERIQDKHDLYLSTIGEGMHTTVNTIGLGFDCYRSLSKEELRFVVVDATEILLEEINSSEELRCHLHHFPFDSHDVQITVFVSDKRKNSPQHPDIAVATSLWGRVEYRTYSPEQRYGYFHIDQEPYGEALAIVHAKIESAPCPN